MKLIHFLIVITVIAACKKSSNSTPNNGTSTNPNIDTSNFITLNGVTNYHYSSSIPTVSCTGGMFFWSNSNTSQPTLGAQILLNTTYPPGSIISHSNNGVVTNYYPRIWNHAQLLRTVNGTTVLRFSNIKAYKNQTDTASNFVLMSGQVACNGK